MKIKSIHVKNFRCIEDESITLENYTALIGRNGCGKSSFLEALELFTTSNYRVDEDDFHNRNTQDEISVAVTFAQLNQDEFTEFSKYIHDDELVVDRVCSWNQDNASIDSIKYHGRKLKCPTFDHIRSQRGRLLLDAYRNQKNMPGFDALPTARSEAEARSNLDAWEEANPDQCELGRDDGQFFGWTNVAVGKLEKYIKLIRVPAIMDATSHWSESSSSTLKLLVDTLVRNVGADAVLEQLREQTEEQYLQILQGNEFSLDQVQSQINQCISEFVPQARAVVDWGAKGAIRVPDPTAVVALEEAGFVGPPHKKGHGLLRAFELAILSMLSENATQDADNQEQADAAPGTLLIGIDEPELYQHPAQARIIADRLKSISGSQMGNYRTLVLTTSHSPLFVTLDNCESVRVVRRGAVGRLHGGAQVWKADLNSMAARIGEVEGNRNFTRETLLPRLSFLFNPQAMEAVFADYVVLVEGDEDTAMITASLQHAGQYERFRKLGIFIVPSGGKANLDRFTLLLKQFGIPHYTIFDSDLNKDGDHQGINNKLVRIITDDRVVVAQVNTHVDEKYTIACNNLAEAVRGEIGTEVYDNALSAASTAHGYPSTKRAMKNPVVVREVLMAAAEQGGTSRTMTEIIAAIAADAQIEINDDQN